MVLFAEIYVEMWLEAAPPKNRVRSALWDDELILGQTPGPGIARAVKL